MEYWKHLGDLFLTVTVPNLLIGLILVWKAQQTQRVVKDGVKETASALGELKATREAMGMLVKDKQEAVALALKVPPPPAVSEQPKGGETK